VKTIDMSLPQFGFIVATRGALGAGVGLLVANKLGSKKRRLVGLALLTLGLVSTIPAVFLVRSHAREQ